TLKAPPVPTPSAAVSLAIQTLTHTPPQTTPDRKGVAVSINGMVTYANLAGHPTATVQWGDGSAATPGPLNGTGGVPALTARHIYARPGVYAVTLTVTDAAGAKVTATTAVDDPGVWLVKGTLYVLGTDQSDRVTISQANPRRLRIGANF